MQPLRFPGYARQIHHLIDSANTIAAPPEAFEGFPIADVAARSLHRARRCRAGSTRINLLWQLLAFGEEIFDAGKSGSRVGYLVRSLEVGGEAHGQSEICVLGWAQPAGFAMIVRIDESRNQVPPFCIHHLGIRTDMAP